MQAKRAGQVKDTTRSAQRKQKKNVSGCKNVDHTGVFAEGKGCISKRHGWSVVGPVDNDLRWRHVSRAGVVGGVRQHQLELLGQLVLAVVYELHVAGGHADAGAEDDAAVAAHAAALVVRAGLQSFEAAALGRPGHRVA